MTDPGPALTVWEKFLVALPTGVLFVALVAAACLIGTAVVPPWAWGI
jgi:hypothetical protein